MATIPIVNSQDKRIGAISSVVAMLLVLLITWLIKYEIVDPPPQELHLEAAEPLDKTIIETAVLANGGGGGGDPSSDPVNNPNTTQNTITNNNSNTTVNSGNANSTTTPNSDNPPSGDNVDNPFAGGFGGGTGGGQGTGNGTGIGNDTGPGTNGPGGGGPSNRKVLSGVDSDDIHYDYPATFHFKVGINADGYVVDVQNIKSKTTTSDERIIRKIIELIKRQVRYSKAPGATIQTKEFVVTYKPR
jgi:hypothetical protein